MACRLIVGNATVVALSAMHPHLHPTFRPPWQYRMRIQAIAAQEMSDRDSRSNLVSTAVATKEAVRRMLATTMTASPAMFNALRRLGHPVGLLTSPPTAMPHKGMEGAMVAFVFAGLELQRTGGDPKDARTYVQTVQYAFDHMGSAGSGMGFAWDASWLGKIKRSEEPGRIPPNALFCCSLRD